jgi:hypothetical protein
MSRDLHEAILVLVQLCRVIAVLQMVSLTLTVLVAVSLGLARWHLDRRVTAMTAEIRRAIAVSESEMERWMNGRLERLQRRLEEGHERDHA